MKAIEHILFPIDFDDIRQPLIDYAIQFVEKDPRTRITFLSIVPEPLEKKETAVRNQLIEDIVEDYPNVLRDNLEWINKSGGVKDSILLAQQELNANLIMMGTRGSDDPQDFTLASQLVLDADCPVLVIPENLKQLKVEKIALSVGNELIHDHSVLITLFAISRLFDAQVHVLTVQQKTEADKEIQRKNDSLLEYYLENLFARHSFSINTDIEQGIFEYVKNFSIDMLAIMPNNHATIEKKSEGLLTKVLTLHTQVPLLTLD